MSSVNLKPVAPQASSSKPLPTPSLLRPWEFRYHGAPDGKDLNLLIMFHGLGDTCEPFAKVGSSFNLPSTAVLSLQAPDQVPLMDGPSFSWYNTFDRMFNPIPSPDPKKHLFTLDKLLSALTSPEIGWRMRDIHLFGWGQGGSMALELAAHVSTSPLAAEQGRRLGSVISICAPLLSPSSSTTHPSQTPVLFFTRLNPASAVYQRQVTRLKQDFHQVEVLNGEKGKTGEDMPRGRAEWEGIMRFWGSTLARDEGWKGEGEVYEVVP